MRRHRQRRDARHGQGLPGHLARRVRRVARQRRGLQHRRPPAPADFGHGDCRTCRCADFNFLPFFVLFGCDCGQAALFLSHCDPLISLWNERGLPFYLVVQRDKRLPFERGLPCYLVVQRDKSLPFYLVVESQCEEAPFFIRANFFCWWRFFECLIGDVCLIEAPHPPAAICA